MPAAWEMETLRGVQGAEAKKAGVLTLTLVLGIAMDEAKPKNGLWILAHLLLAKGTLQPRE